MRSILVFALFLALSGVTGAAPIEEPDPGFSLSTLDSDGSVFSSIMMGADGLGIIAYAGGGVAGAEEARPLSRASSAVRFAVARSPHWRTASGVR